MPQYLIVCRSLTYAQRTAKTLERAGVFSAIVRAPAELTGTGCGYCVKLSGKKLAEALQTLKQNGLTPVKILLRREDGSFREVDPLEN